MKKYNFIAEIKESKIGKGGAYIEFPYDVEKEFGKKGRIKVVAFFDGVEYRGSLVKMGTDCHILGIQKAIRKKINKDIGDNVEITLYEDTDERKIILNKLLENKLKENNLIEVFEKLSYSKKKEYNNLIENAKKEETKLKRLEKIISELKRG
ncbi:YdeI/OmpD-associated family protein [Marinitoga litoralis]|uniref:YdeI/OmpD-associated family protein n=1 Tax=Marinitoga litoralis TaxID=570855 RepID=UPI001961A48A|nr:YdeI/OmpD-associated family protein [Marinitoga litoralis]MBM7558420.1 bifunctional DNA-binding transcriptional regulator/antitoxin component of YhaV-PrlF toxin-antitoxin module [Marinitoga litoralis]